MRVLNRNKQSLYYANYVSRSEIINADGNYTGEYTVVYTNPVEASWNINVVESDAEVEMFGVQAIDTIVGIAENDEFPLSETSILWYGITPVIKTDGTTDTVYNYRIVGIRPSLNFIKFYAQRVNITQAVS